MRNRYSAKTTFTTVMGIILASVLFSQFISENILFKASILGKSMEPTYYEGNFVIVSRVSDIDRNDVVVVYKEELGKYIVKRCVGVPGDRLKLKDSVLFVNGEPSYDIWSIGITESADLMKGITLGDGQYYVLGDNREESLDSRGFGCIEEKEIQGVVLFSKR